MSAAIVGLGSLDFLEHVVDRVASDYRGFLWRSARNQPNTTLRKDLSAAKIKVVGPEGGFINSVLQIQSKFGLLNIRVIVDSVNITAYEIFE